jgi:hypothetical protein
MGDIGDAIIRKKVLEINGRFSLIRFAVVGCLLPIILEFS